MFYFTHNRWQARSDDQNEIVIGTRLFVVGREGLIVHLFHGFIRSMIEQLMLVGPGRVRQNELGMLCFHVVLERIFTRVPLSTKLTF